MSLPVRRGLLLVAIAAGALAPFAGSPYRSGSGQIDVAALASAVQQEQDHVSAIELAEWIKDRKAGLQLIDVRGAEEFDEFHIPTARQIPLDALVRTTFPPSDTIVLYSGGGAHAAQGWVFLRALGYRQVYFLSGGLDEWLEDVMNPVLGENATPDQKRAFEHVAELSRYFGGVPRTGVADAGPTTRSSSRDAAARTRRRGC